MTVSEAVKDPGFLGLPPAEQLKALAALDQNFAGLPPEEQTKALGALTSGQAAPAQKPAPSWSARPFFQAAGAALGGAPGIALAPAAGPLPMVAGAGLGGAIGGKVYDIGKGYLSGGHTFGPTTGAELGREALRTAKDVGTSAEAEMMGQSAGAVVGNLLSGVASRRAAKQAARAAEQAPLKRAAAEQGIPLTASDITQSKPVRQIENFPSYFALGSGKVQRIREGQLGAARESVGRLGQDIGESPGALAVGAASKEARESGLRVAESATRSVADRVAQTEADAITTGLAAQGGTKRVVEAWRLQKARLFNDVANLAGDEPVVSTEGLQGAAKALGLEEGIPGLTAIGQKAYAQAMGSEAVPFGVARQLEAELGARAFNKSTVGTIPQGHVAALWRGVHNGIDDFMATEPTGAVAPALAEAKQVYATGKQLFNDSAKRLVLGTRTQPLAAEKVVERVFRPGNITDTLDFKQLVDDSTYQQAAGTWLRGLIQKATGQDGFSPVQFARQVAPYERTGHLDVILEPHVARQVRGLAGFMGQMETPLIKQLASLPPEQVVGEVFRPGNIQGIVQYRSLVDPNTYQQAVRTWWDNTTAKATSNEVFYPSRFARELTKYDQNGQLDLMLGPELANRAREIGGVFNRLGNAEKLAANWSGTGQAIGSSAQILGIAQKGLMRVAADLGLPWAVGQAAFSGPGQRMLSGGYAFPKAGPLVPSLLDLVDPRSLRAITHGITARARGEAR